MVEYVFQFVQVKFSARIRAWKTEELIGTHDLTSVSERSFIVTANVLFKLRAVLEILMSSDFLTSNNSARLLKVLHGLEEEKRSDTAYVP